MISEEWKPKLFTLLKDGINQKQLKRDISSGVLVGIIALPLAIAFAIASGVSPDKGIITAIIAGFIISFLGGSRVQIGGPTGAFIVIVSSIISRYGFNGLLISTFMAGIILIFMGILKMGSLLKYIPQTLITGFTTAIAVIIFTTQIKDFLGLTVTSVPDKFISKWIFYVQNLNNINLWSIFIGILTIVIIIILPRLTKKLPAAFAALIITTIIAKFGDLPVDTIFSKFGNLSFSVPRPVLFTLDFQTVKTLLAPAVTIALLGSLESLLSAVVADGMIGGRHRSNIELIAQGAANMLVPLFGGIPATGAIARTAANVNNGGRTPIAGIVHAVTLFLIYLVAMPIVKYIPMASLSGILILVAWNMSDMKEFVNIIKINIYEAMVLLTTFVLTLITDLTIAIPIGFVLSTILFMKRMSDSIELTPLLTINKENGEIFSQEIGAFSKEILIFDINGPMFFGSVHHLLSVRNQIHTDHKFLILRFRYVPIVDASGLKKLESVLKDFQKRNIPVVFSGVNNKLRKKFSTSSLLDDDLVFEDIHEALAYAENELKA
ncbi:MAG: STAS domain-containing protein [Spirochaetaceae bacterium]|nr:STAS domain-containing protein [Spirochaetaceae bacterium]